MIGRIIMALAIALAILAAADMWLHGHRYFALGDIPAFHSGFGLLAALGLALGARAFAALFRRRGDYYREDHGD